MRRRVVLLVTATTLLVLVSFLVPLTVLLGTLARDRAVGEATKDAQGLAVLVAVADSAQLRDAVTLLNERGDREVGVELADGTSLGPRDKGSATSLALARAGRSFTTTVGEGREVYVPVDTSNGRVVIRSFVGESVLNRGVSVAATILVVLAGGLLLIAVLVADRLGVSIVSPVRDLETTALALAGGDLSARAAVRGPHEVQEVAHALNVLGQRIRELLAAEREAVADLSHRLRTPLTALRLDAESCTDVVASERLLRHVDVLQRSIDEIIREARRPVREGMREECDAAEVVRARAAFWSILIEEQSRPFVLEVQPTPSPVRITADDLGAVVDALLQNALAHTPEGVEIALRVGPRPDGGAELVVTDAGPGFSAGAVERGVSTAGSTGLGLDIAVRAAEASGGFAVLGRAESGGASIVLVFGPAS